MPAPAITVEELKAKQDRGEPVTIVDVREPHEWAINGLPGSLKIPLGALPQRFSEIPKDAEVVVHCRSGGRSARAVEFLRARGYDRAFNLAGGINRWADVVDPAMPRY